MTASGRRLTRVLLVVGASLAVVAASVPEGAAHADVAFRKKKPPAGSDEASPSGGEGSGEVGNAPATDSEAPAAPKTDFVPQAEDKDRPRDPSLLSANAADAAVKKKAKKDEPPIYTKWQFWAITGGVAVGLVGAFFGGRALLHSMNGGDVRPCNPMFSGCFGEGH